METENHSGIKRISKITGTKQAIINVIWNEKKQVFPAILQNNHRPPSGAFIHQNEIAFENLANRKSIETNKDVLTNV